MSNASDPRPFVLGLAGGSGSGKTTLLEELTERIAGLEPATLHHDDYYRDQTERSSTERAAVNYDSLDALESTLLAEQLRDLVEGRPIQAPLYCFEQHTRKPEVRSVAPSRVILVEGILLFAEPALTRLFDVRVFVDAPSSTRVVRRMRRDVAHRGREPEQVCDQLLDTVIPAHDDLVEPSKEHADLIVSGMADVERTAGLLEALVIGHLFGSV